MSDKSDSPGCPSQLSAAASEWAVQKQAGLTSAQEEAFAAWLAASAQHRLEFDRLSALSSALDRARACGASETIVTKLRVRQRRRRQQRRALVAAGLAVLVALAANWGIRHVAESAAGSVAGAAPIRRLPDGSIVELNGQAQIAVKYDAGQRMVELLRGEALFRVEKDPSRPFIVRAAGIKVSALGTAFSVRLQPAAVEVLVTEGRVGINDARNGSSLLPEERGRPSPALVAGQDLTVGDATQASPTRTVRLANFSNEEIRQRLSWRVPNLQFDGEPLGDAVAQMNAVNRLQIVIRGDGIRRLRISGDFAPDNPEAFARLVSASLGLRWHRGGDNEIVLSAEP